MSGLKVGEIKKEQLKKHTKRVWSKFMTPEYIFTENGKEYYYIEFTGWDKMESEWRIIKIEEARKRLNE